MKFKITVKLLISFSLIFIGHINLYAQQKPIPSTETTDAPADLQQRITITRSQLIDTLTAKDASLSFAESGKSKGNPVYKASGSKAYSVEIIGTDKNIVEASSTIIIPTFIDALNEELSRQALLAITVAGKPAMDWYYKQISMLKSPITGFHSSTTLYTLTKLTVDYYPASRSLSLTITSL